MSGRLQRLELDHKRTMQKPLIIALFVSCVSMSFILRSPDFLAVVLSALARLVQNFEANAHFDTAFILRTQGDLLQSLSAQALGRGEWVCLEFRPRSLPTVMRVKFAFMVAAVDISVIVPTLNEEKYLAKCLHSLTNQSFEGDYETIVVDSGSTDRTLEIAEHFADRVITDAKRPVGAARNQGVSIAKGGIVAFIDADSMSSDTWLGAIARVLDNKDIIGVTGPTLPSSGDLIDFITYRLWTIYLQRILLSIGMPHVIGFNCAYRKEAFRQVGGFDETSMMSEDIKLALKMRRLGRIAFEKQMLALTSSRRFHRYGHAYIASLYVLNGFSTLLLNKSYKNYPPVR